MKQLTIAIDFDDTFTADPMLFSELIKHAVARGHKCYIVTARRNTVDNVDLVNAQLDFWQCQCPVVFSNLGSKIAKMKAMDIEVDIWIDDDPRTLVHGH